MIETLSPREILEKVRQSRPRDKRCLGNRDLYNGDHWGNGKYWVGPMPDDDAPERERQEVLKTIERNFVSQNVVEEVVNRHIAALLGRDPTWAVTHGKVAMPEEGKNPSAQQRSAMELVAEADAVLTAWWNYHNATELMSSVAVTGLLERYALVRALIPTAVLEDNGTLEAETPKDAVRYIYIEEVDAETGGVYRHPETFERCAVLGLGKPTVTGYEEAEVAFFEDDDTVLLHTAKFDSTLEDLMTPDADDVDFVYLNLARTLTMYEFRINALISPQIRQCQMQLNKTLSMMAHNTDVAGFMQQIMLNAQMPGHYEKDPVTGKDKFIVDKVRAGAGVVQFFVGVESDDADGKTTYASPQAIFRQPVPVATFTETNDAWTRAILREARQLHALTTGDANSSAASRIQALADFLVSILPTKIRLDALGRWMAKTVLGMCAEIAGDPGRYADLDIEFSSIIDLGPLTPEEMQAILQLVAADMLSREEGMTRLRVADPAGEWKRILAEKQARAEISTNVGSALMERFTDGDV